MKFAPVLARKTVIQSPPVREAWIEILGIDKEAAAKASPPVREAWIEIAINNALAESDTVASREGGVD